MKEHGLVFCPEMIQAFLDGHKTMTRRRMRPQPETVFNLPAFPRCPYSVGDLVYAKETVYVSPMYPFPHQYIRPTPKGQRLPPPPAPDDIVSRRGPWRLCAWGWRVFTNRFMPKAYARIWRKIVEVRPPERVQAISYEDILSEGWDCRTSEPWGEKATAGQDARAWWQTLWTRLHGPESWEANPWVWPLVLGEKVQP